MHVIYTINLIGLNESYILKWSCLIKRWINQYLSIGNSTNVAQQQFHESVNAKLQYVIDGQLQLGDQMMEAKETITQTVTIAIMV
jgi:hypothetical protein